MRLPIRRIALLVGVLVVGIGLGRFVVPLLEVRSELTVIANSTKRKGCAFPTSETTFFLGRPQWLIDGGILLKCAERRQIAKGAFVYCECDDDL